MRQFTERDQAREANRDGEYVLWFEADLYDQQSNSRAETLRTPASPQAGLIAPAVAGQ